MRNTKPMLVIAFICLFTLSSAAMQQHHLSPKVATIQMSTEEGYRMYEHWTTQAFASVLSVFLQEKHSKNELGIVPDHFNECYFGAQTVPLMAKCIVRLLNKEFEIELNRAKNVDGTNELVKKQKWVGQIRMDSESGEEREKERQKAAVNEQPEKINSSAEKGGGLSKISYYNTMPKFEWAKVQKRETVFGGDQRNLGNGRIPLMRKRQNVAASRNQSYNLLEAKRTFGLSPIGGLARLLMSGVLERKNKTRTIPWQETITKIQEAKKAHNQLKRDENKWRDYALKEKPFKSMSADGRHREYEKKERLFRMNSANDKGYGNKVNVFEQQIAKLVNDGIKVGMRLADLQKKSNSTESSKSEESADEVQRTAEETKDDEMEEEEEYGMEENGEYGKSSERRQKRKRMKGETGRLMDILSPRFMSVTARKSRGKENFLSPSLFSLHNKGHGLERRLSLPNLIKEGAQLVDRDQNEWLNLIMEASGVNEQVDTIKHLLSSADGNDQQEEMAKKVEKRYKREFDGLYLTKENVREMYGQEEQRKSDIWEKLVQNLNKEQWEEMNRTGIVSMNAKQLYLFYGPTSPFNDSKTLQRLLPIVKNGSPISKLIELDVHRMSEMSSFDLRQNDVLSPSVFKPSIRRPRTGNPIILSPVVFSPTILSPTIMGFCFLFFHLFNLIHFYFPFWPAILSPRVFSPPILSPRIMTPLVLSPFIFSSIILTPVIMQPFILSPGFLNSIIMSPFIMNPQIMSSHFFHPAILSPFVLTPAILNPTMMSPFVLSPLVLTPQIFSPKLLSGLFLSPYALSPVFLSPVFAYLVILSPSWLS